MANRARDLTFSILSDTNKFSTDAPAADLEDLASSADTAGAQLDDLERARERLDLDRLGTDATDTARKVDNAFDKMSRASQTSTRKIDDDADETKRSLRDVGSEAGDSAREMSASFSGGADDVLGTFQEIAGNAGAAFGPIGLAAGVAMGVGIGLITAQAQKLKDLASSLVQDMIDAGGKLDTAAIDARVKTMAADDPMGFVKYNEQAKKFGISIRDVARARAGDADAIERIRDRLDEVREKEYDAAKAAGNTVAQRNSATSALGSLMSELGLVTEAAAIAEDAVSTATATNGENLETYARTAKGNWDDLRSSLKDPVRATVKFSMPTRSTFISARADLTRGIGTLVIPVKPGQSRFENNANNSRYRE